MRVLPTSTSALKPRTPRPRAHSNMRAWMGALAGALDALIGEVPSISRREPGLRTSRLSWKRDAEALVWQPPFAS